MVFDTRIFPHTETHFHSRSRVSLIGSSAHGAGAHEDFTLESQRKAKVLEELKISLQLLMVPCRMNNL